MEHNNGNSDNVLMKQAVAAAHIEKGPIEDESSSSSAKRRKGTMRLLRVAIFMMRRPSRKSRSLQADVASKSMWRRFFFASMKNLPQPSDHVPNHQLKPHAQLRLNNINKNLHKYSNHDQDPTSVLSPPMSPADAGSQYTTSECSMSRFASVINLQELDCNDDDAINCRCSSSSINNNNFVTDKTIQKCLDGDYSNVDNNGGDEDIDAKAEKFIAQFYQQIRLQRLDSADRRYTEMMERSLA